MMEENGLSAKTTTTLFLWVLINIFILDFSRKFSSSAVPKYLLPALWRSAYNSNYLACKPYIIIAYIILGIEFGFQLTKNSSDSVIRDWVWFQDSCWLLSQVVLSLPENVCTRFGSVLLSCKVWFHLIFIEKPIRLQILWLLQNTVTNRNCNMLIKQSFQDYKDFLVPI